MGIKPQRVTDLPAVRIEAENEWAWCGTSRLDLTPRTFAVLRHLVQHPQRLITKDDLLAAVWGQTSVSDSALTSCIRDLREALKDSARSPRYIETVHRRGFRFVGPIANVAVAPPPPAAPAVSQTPGRRLTTLVGRNAELAMLNSRLAAALADERQMLLINGEPGIGKTALVEAFLGDIAGNGPRIARGQCVEQYGAGEAYMPVLEALGRLGREGDEGRLLHTLKQYAPTWLVQLPALLSDGDLETVARRAQGATRDRMLRELVEALEALSSSKPLVLVLEDLHWSDSATIDLLAMLARRREPARLLIIGTYRPADVAVKGHPLQRVKQELVMHELCEELSLEFLSVEAVQEYLTRRFVSHEFPAGLAIVLHRITDGNPLFLINTVGDLIARGQLHQSDGRWQLTVDVNRLADEVPPTLAQIVAQQIERLPANEQAVLAAASAAGPQWSAALAVASGIDAAEAERCCEALARRNQFLRAKGLTEWPDGTVAGCYAFIHAVYQTVLYSRVPIGERVGLHQRIGERLERAYRTRAAEIAGELAVHFEEGRDFERGSHYHVLAAEQALRQHGYREAADHLARALTFQSQLPESESRLEQELMLQVMRGTVLTALLGHAAREVESAYARARSLSDRVKDFSRLRLVMPGIAWFYLVRGPAATVRELTGRMKKLAEDNGDQALLLAAHHSAGALGYYTGEFEDACEHLDRGSAIYDPAEHSPGRSPVFRSNVDPAGSCALHGAAALLALGYIGRAGARLQEALAFARASNHPFSVAHAHRYAAAFYHTLGDVAATSEHTDACIAVAREHGFAAVLNAASFHLGWVRMQRGDTADGLPMMREWLPVCREIRAMVLMPVYAAWLATVQCEIDCPSDGLALVDEGLSVARRSGYSFWSAELYRLKGLMLQHPAAAHPARASRDKQAESCFLEALQLARQQHAKLFELRAATALGRLSMKQGKAAEALELLSTVYGWFTDGHDIADLRDAAAVIEQLEAARVTGSPSRRRPSS